MTGLVLALPMAAIAQIAVFTDNFTNGSTTNLASVPGGTTAASFTSYDIASTKATTNCTITSGRLRLSLNSATTGGFAEAQAVFTTLPVSLNTVGDYINMTYTFMGTNLLAGGPPSYIWQGLYNSGGSAPVSGGALINNLQGTDHSGGNCANWQGYASRISNLGTNEAYTRPLQNGGSVTNANQELVGSGAGTGSYANPGGAVFGGAETLNAVNLTAGQPYTVSYSITLSAAAQLTISNFLYSGAGVNPGNLLFSQTNIAATTNFLTSSFDGLCIGVRNSGTSFNPDLEVSNITVVESIAGSPGPLFNVTGGGIGCPGNSFVVNLNGSVSSNSYFLYTNGVFNGSVVPGSASGSAISFPAETVISVPLTNTVIASNTVNGFLGAMNGQVIVGPQTAPTITNQPVSVTVATNSTAVFVVGASGTALSYQWYKNGTALIDGGDISGSTNSTLIISPAMTADAASPALGYYCIVSDPCGFSATSTTNSLTLDAAANLVWQGGNPNTNWDLATTANFLNGATPAIFNSGDNVTFNDNSPNNNVTIVGNFITPGVITESSAINYTFSGSGVIQGSGSLAMSGTGTLTINNSNAYSGGTMISGGMVTVSNANLSSLGTGPVNMAGGTLYIPLKGSGSLGFSNNVNVTSDSTLQYVQTGTFACVLSGPLTGNANKTLTVSLFNSSTGTARLRMYSPFTNNANMALSSLGTEIEMAPYVNSNSIGQALNQIYNGVISGTSGRFVPREHGNVIFTGANTWVDQLGPNTPGYYSLLMSGGNVGIGADSVSSVPPTIDSSPVGTGIVAINANTNNEGGDCSFFAYGGAHTIANQFIYTTTTNDVTVIFQGSNALTLTGEFDLANTSDPNGAQRKLEVTNTAPTTLAGTISDNTANDGGATPSGITKRGNGSLYLNGANTYVGQTTVSNGILAGSGSIAGPVDVETNGSIGGGPASGIGTLTINNNLTLNGNVFIRVDKDLSPAQSNDLISVSGTLSSSGTGTVTVANIGTTALAVGDKFQIFSRQVSGANTLSITGGGMLWTNRLGTDGSIAVLSAAPAVATNPTNIIVSVSNGTNLSLSWPGDHLGWTLQTNPVGLTSSNNWFPYPGSASVTNENLIMDRTQKNVFFRMVYQIP